MSLHYILLCNACYQVKIDHSFLSRRVLSQERSHFSTQPQEHNPLQIGTASFPYSVSYHSMHPSPPSSIGPSTYHVWQMEHTSCHICRRSACIALSRMYSGNSGAFPMSVRLKLAASVRDANSTKVGMRDVRGGRRGKCVARIVARVATCELGGVGKGA